MKELIGGGITSFKNANGEVTIYIDDISGDYEIINESDGQTLLRGKTELSPDPYNKYIFEYEETENGVDYKPISPVTSEDVVTESTEEKLQEVEEFNPGQMLPQGTGVEKPVKLYKNPNYTPVELRLTESVIDYIINNAYPIHYYKESLQDEMINFNTELNIPRKLRIAILNTAILDRKLSYTKDAAKRAEIKLEINKNKKITKDMISALSPSEQKMISALTKKATELAGKAVEKADKPSDLDEDTTELHRKESDKKDKNLNESEEVTEKSSFEISDNARINYWTQLISELQNRLNNMKDTNEIVKTKAKIKEYTKKIEDIKNTDKTSSGIGLHGKMHYMAASTEEEPIPVGLDVHTEACRKEIEDLENRLETLLKESENHKFEIQALQRAINDNLNRLNVLEAAKADANKTEKDIHILIRPAKDDMYYISIDVKYMNFMTDKNKISQIYQTLNPKIFTVPPKNIVDINKAIQNREAVYFGYTSAESVVDDFDILKKKFNINGKLYCLPKGSTSIKELKPININQLRTTNSQPVKESVYTMNDYNSILVNTFMRELDHVFEAADIEPEIKPIIDELNSKGYKTKYSSPGHTTLRKKEDKEPDGVYYNKLYSDARIMFGGKYNFPSAPKHWYWRDVDGCDYLDVKPFPYDEKDGTPNEAFEKWKNNYMETLKTWVHNLKPADSFKAIEKEKDEKGGKDFESKDTHESVQDLQDIISMNLDMIFKENGIS